MKGKIRNHSPTLNPYPSKTPINKGCPIFYHPPKRITKEKVG